VASSLGNRAAARSAIGRNSSQNRGKASLLDKLNGKAATLSGKAA
jgi:hypothetical protein